MEPFWEEAALVITLRSGERLVARLTGDEQSARGRLLAAQAQLAAEQYILVGDEIVVRADEVRSVELMHDPPDPAFSQHETVPEPSYESTWGAHRPRRHGTALVDRAYELLRATFGTAPLPPGEVVAAVVGVVGVVLAALIANDLDAQGASLVVALILSAYILSRGIAKAGREAPRDRPR